MLPQIMTNKAAFQVKYFGTCITWVIKLTHWKAALRKLLFTSDYFLTQSIAQISQIIDE